MMNALPRFRPLGRIVFVFGVFLLANCLVPGISRAGPPPNPPAKPSSTFRIICGGNWDSEAIKYDPTPGGKPVTLEFGRALSSPYPSPAQEKLVLYQELPVPEGSPPGTRPVKNTVATLGIPKGQLNTLVVIIPDPSGKLTFKALPDDAAKHPAGTLRILNFSRFPAGIGINSQNYTVGIDSADSVVPYASGGTLIQAAIQKDGKWTASYRRERIARPRLRSYGFIFNFIAEVGADDGGPPPPTLFYLFSEFPPIPSGPASGA